MIKTNNKHMKKNRQNPRTKEKKRNKKYSKNSIGSQKN